MKDIPFFHTENGVASLRLKEIPYFHRAYVTIQCASNEEQLLEECIAFCCVAGAEKVYAAGFTGKCVDSIDVIKMTRKVDDLYYTGAMLFPVEEETMPHWREIYNQKMYNVTGAAYINDAMAREILEDRKAYFVHKNGQLIGIGTASGNEISVVASVKKGAGKDVVCALLGALSEDTAVVEVASDNQKAVALYNSLGFVATGIARSWYKIFDIVK